MSSSTHQEQYSHQEQYNILARVLNKMYQVEYSKENWELLYKPLMHNLFLQYIPEKARILDLGCGSGQLANHLIKSGYQVTGIDISDQFLVYARQNAPGGEFIQGDLRDIEYSPTFNGIFSKGALMVMMSLEKLEDVLSIVYGALLDNGIFLFDVRREETVKSWGTSLADAEIKTLTIEDDYIWICRSTYDPEKKIMHNFFTVFELVNEQWLRADTNFQGKVFSTEEIKTSLEKVGFTKIEIYQEGKDLGFDGVMDRSIFVCRKPAIVSV
ncbi:MAG: methyltransferase domain-containing protein [Moorea sp. SIO2I5]|nr:methyltransferase domain-containing protein [Moorena sp. SIO2I5]